jgi:hypothetical protein
MMIFTEPKFVKKIQLMRQKHAPHHKTMVVPMYIEDSIFYSHLQDMITLFQEGRIPLGYNPEKDTAYYVWCMWQKFDCVARALEINPWNAARTYFIDFGIYHVAKPAELSDLLDQFQKCPRLKMTLLLPKDVKTLFKKAYDQFVFDVQARDSNNKSNKSNQVNNKRAGFPCRANTFPREQWYSRKRQSAGGGVFGGPNAYVAWFCREFMIQATEVLKKYRWSPLDESVMTTIMMDNPEKCLVIIADHPEMLLVKPDDQIFISTDSFLHNGEFDRAQDCLKECSKVASEDPKYFKLLQRSQLLVLPSVQKSSDQPPTIAGTPPQNQPPTSAAHHHPSSDKAQKTCDCACCQREQETEKNQSVTMVTAYWEVVNTTTTTVRPASFYMESALQLMNIPSPMIIYTTEPFGSTLMAKRKELGFEAQTLIKDISKRLEPERWIPLIEANRAIYWPSRDSRAPAMVHLINCLGKTLSMMDAIETNPFRTTHVAWFDFGLARSGFSDRKFNLDLATRWVNTPKPEKVRILQMRDIAPRLLQDCLHEIKTYYNDPSLKTTQERIKKCTALRQLYSRYRFGYAGNLWSSGVQTGLLFCRSMQDLFVKLTYLGFGHSEEIFVALLHEEQPDLFSIAFGDYQNVFENFYRPSHNQAFLQNLALEAKTHGRLELFNTISNLLKSNCQSK